ncbi:hypothetical protein M9H77_13863 [Catharanthus roseus]|uniref:Uncharacterized protein n=1 Tax=Catharanthus roseus TaxID=4058 RepID=A0ACC0BLM0_CATRO|nr:hypothetical protein M9H77_13863 [Catharanthus roseus]
MKEERKKKKEGGQGHRRQDLTAAAANGEKGKRRKRREERRDVVMVPGGRRLTLVGTSNGGSNALLMHASNESLETSSPSQIEDISHLDTSGNTLAKKEMDVERVHESHKKRIYENGGKPLRLSFQKALGDHFNISLTLLACRVGARFKFKDWDANKEVKGYVDDMLKISYRHWRNQLRKDYKNLKGSLVNIVNCKKLPYSQTGGSKSFHARFAEMEELVQKKRQRVENGEPFAEEEILADTITKRFRYVIGIGLELCH